MVYSAIVLMLIYILMLEMVVYNRLCVIYSTVCCTPMDVPLLTCLYDFLSSVFVSTLALNYLMTVYVDLNHESS